MPATPPNPTSPPTVVEPKQAQAVIRLREGELEFLFRLRQLRNQAGDQRIRLDVEISKENISILNQFLFKPEAFALH